MGTVVYLVRPAACAPHLARGPKRNSTPTGRGGRAIEHIRRAIDRYVRDLALMEGRCLPAEGSLDDQVILDYLDSQPDRNAVIVDRRLRILTLQATLDTLIEAAREETGIKATQGCIRYNGRREWRLRG